jgi:uncharacterized membrane protein YoaK (UPF0700 family)
VEDLSVTVDLDRLRASAAANVSHPLTRALLTLTFTTGIVDAVSFLALGNVFTANMTGNIVLLGFGIAGSGGLPVLAPLLSLGAFLVGAGGGGAIAARTAKPHPAGLARALAVEVLLIGAAAIVAVLVAIEPNQASGYAVIVMLAAAMGMRNAIVHRIGVPDMATTVVTMAITDLASQSPLAGGSGRGSARRAAAVLAMLTGAVAGALLLKESIELALAAAAALALLVALGYVPGARRRAVTT